MGPYLKGIVNGRHVFDLSLTISNLRKMIRLLQSLIMDECQILFVCNDKDPEMVILSKIMCTRCNIPLLDDKWSPGSLTNWNHMAEHYRGPGRELIDGKLPKQRPWKKTKLHRLMREPPDFIFLLNRRENDILVHEANRMQIPVASLCDSDDSTRDLQYIIPCNTQSIQSMHFILDMITRGILEAQTKMDSLWWSKQKDQQIDRNALMDAEIEWQYKYDPYQQQRLSTRMMAGPGGGPGGSATDNTQENLDIATNYIKDDQNIQDIDTDIDGKHNRIVLAKYGNIHSPSPEQQQQQNDSKDSDNFSQIDPIQQSRINKRNEIFDNPSNEYNRKYTEKQNEIHDDNKKYVQKFGLPKQFETTSDFALKMLQDYATNQGKNKQRLDRITKNKK